MYRTLGWQGRTKGELQSKFLLAGHLMRPVYKDKLMYVCGEGRDIKLKRWKEKLVYSLAFFFFSHKHRNKKFFKALLKYSFKSCGVVMDLQEILSSNRPAWQAVNSDRRWTYFNKA